MELKDYIESGVVILTALSLIYIKWRENVLTRRKEKEAPAKLSQDRENNAKIYPILWEILSSLSGAKRVSVIQYHNGGRFFSGKSINRMTMTHEVVKTGIVHISKDVKDLIINRPHSLLVDDLVSDGIAHHSDVEKIEEADLKNFFKYYKTKSACYILLKDSSERPVGALAVTSQKVNAFSDSDIAGLTLRANNIVSILEK